MTTNDYLTEFEHLLTTGNYENLITIFESIVNSETFLALGPKQQVQSYEFYYRANQRLNNLVKTFEIIDEMKTKYAELKNKKILYYSSIFVLEGTSLISIKKYNDAEIIVNEGFHYIEGFNETKEADLNYVTNITALLFNLLGILYGSFYGNLSESTKAYEKCLKFSEQTNFGFGINLAQVNLTTNYSSQGDFSKAEYYIKESFKRLKLFYESLGPLEDNKDWFYAQIFCKSNLGIIQFNKGNYLGSKNTFLELLKVINGTVFESRFFMEINYPLLKNFLTENDFESSKKLLEHMEIYPTKDPEDKLLYYHGLVLYYLKMNNLRDKFKAIPYIDKIQNQNLGFVFLKNDAKFNLIELNLLELKANFDEKLFNETLNLINEIYEFSNTNNSFITLVNLLILKSRLSRIIGNLEESESLLNEALGISEKNLTKFYFDKVRQEKEDLIDEFRKWNDMINNNTPLSKRFHELEMEKYFEDVKSILPLRLKE